jgi:hypothetical protein
MPTAPAPTLLTTLSLLLLTTTPTLVSAHGHISQVLADSLPYYGHDPTKVPWGPQPASITWTNAARDNGYVPSNATILASRDINCHLNSTNGLLTAPVTAGSSVHLTWNQWPESHHGPIVDYLASCSVPGNEGGDCTTVDPDALRWFKLAELGQLRLSTEGGVAGYWATDVLIHEKNLTWSVQVPETLAPGGYVLRHEIISLHPGGAENSTQMYPQCVNLEVRNEGSGTVGLPAEKGTLGRELYGSLEGGLVYNIYVDFWAPERRYSIPGPAVYKF